MKRGEYLKNNEEKQLEMISDGFSRLMSKKKNLSKGYLRDICYEFYQEGARIGRAAMIKSMQLEINNKAENKDETIRAGS